MAFHVNTDTGNSGQCRAQKGKCPFGGESGSDNHYNTPQEAAQAAEAYMEQVYKDVHRSYSAGERVADTMHIDMKRRLINAAVEGEVKLHPAVIGRLLSQDKDEIARKHVAEKLNSQKLLRDMSDDKSERVRKAVAMRSNNRAVLAKLSSDSDAKVRFAAMNNPKTPVAAMKAAKEAQRQANIANLAKAKAKKADA